MPILTYLTIQCKKSKMEYLMIVISIAVFISLKVSVIEDRFWFARLSSLVTTFTFPAESKSCTRGDYHTAPNSHIV